MGTGLRTLCASKRAEHSGDTRYVDLRVDLVREGDLSALSSAGGKWDRKRKAYVDEAELARRFRMHPGQEAAVEWFRDWMAARARGEFLTLPVTRKDRTVAERPVWVMLNVGGRRGGKTDFATKAGVQFAVARKASKVWLISESQPKTEELDDVVQGLLPRAWYARLGAPWFRYTLANGSKLHLRSAYDPETLKRGRCDLAVLNEAQNMKERAFAIVRAAVADTGGLVMIAANPPEEAKGQWIADMYEEAKAQRRAVKVFVFDPRANPHVVHESLEDMAHDVSERTYRIEILGEFLARTDIVWPEWNALDNEIPTPELGDETPAFLKAKLGQPFDAFVGVDFQLTPHMAAVVGGAYQNGGCPCGDSHLWFRDELVVENGDEDDLADALLELGLEPKRTALIIDASGEWQDADRTKGRASADMLRKRGFVHLYLPERKSKRNPPILERVKAAAARMCDASGLRHVFSDPRNLYLNRAIRQWELRKGSPYRRSEFAHFCDAFSYPLYRFFPRKRIAKRFAFELVERKHKNDLGKIY